MVRIRHTIELKCPVCFRTFYSESVLPVDTSAGDRSGRKRTDFQEEEAGAVQLPYAVHSCFRCGYSGSELAFGDQGHIRRTVAVLVRSEITPKLPRGRLSTSDKYELAATIADWEGAPPQQIGALLLTAAWCCIYEGDVEAERYFRRKAAWRFESALERRDAIAPYARAGLTYLVGELWRRIGDVKAAARWFNRVPSEIVAPERQQWIADAATQQRDEPREWFEHAEENESCSRQVHDVMDASHQDDEMMGPSGAPPVMSGRADQRWAEMKVVSLVAILASLAVGILVLGPR